MRSEAARPAPVSQIIGSPLRKTNSERRVAAGRAAAVAAGAGRGAVADIRSPCISGAGAGA